MNNIKLLTKYFLKDFFDGKKVSSVVKVLLSFLCVILISLPLVSLVMISYDGLSKNNNQGLLLTMILLSGSLINLLVGIFTVFNVFFFSEDTDILLPMPFTPSEIIMSKFLVLMVSMGIYSCMILAPLIAYGVNSGAGVFYYIAMVFVIIATTMFPLFICLVLSLIAMRFTNLSKYKDAFKKIGGVFILAVVVAINFLTNNSTMDASGVIQNNRKSIGIFSNIFFTNKFSFNALFYSNSSKGIINLLILIVISVALLFVLCYVSEKIYFKSITGMSETMSKREDILKTKKKVIKEKSPLMTLASRDLKIIFRNPAFFMNCVVMLVYMPAIYFVIAFSGMSRMLHSSSAPLFLVAGSFLATSFIIVSGSAATTALNREGKDIIVSKYIPVSYKTQVHSKIVSSFIINAFSIVLGIMILIYAKAPILSSIMFIIIQIITVLMISLLGLYINYCSPNVSWENEKDMFKRNFTPFILMVVFLIIGGGMTALGLLIKNQFLIFIMNVAIVSIVALIIYKLLVNKAYKAYDEI